LKLGYPFYEFLGSFILEKYSLWMSSIVELYQNITQSCLIL
jgi:hypothetical protein